MTLEQSIQSFEEYKAILIAMAREGYIKEYLADSEYLAGVKAGWNAAHSDNPEEKMKAIFENCRGNK